jgi:hypothetical protein
MTDAVVATPDMDAFRAPDRTVARWSETAFVSGRSLHNEFGFFLHAGRCPTDLDLWWAQVATYLPGGDLAVGYTWGRCLDRAAITTGNLDLRVIAPHQQWSIRYDGVGQRTTTSALAAHTVGSGPALPMKWDINAHAAFPAWNMHNPTSTGSADDWASAMHTQQAFRATGTISLGEETHDFDGVCYNDHSRGVRSWGAFSGDISLMAVYPDFAVHGIKVWGPEGDVKITAGVLFDSHGSARPVRIDFPAETDMLGNPRMLGVTIQDPDGGTELSMRAEALHVFPIAVTEHNDNLNGIDWDIPGDPLIFTESLVKLTTEDGQVGYGNLERSHKRSKDRQGRPEGDTNARPPSGAPVATVGE